MKRCLRQRHRGYRDLQQICLPEIPEVRLKWPQSIRHRAEELVALGALALGKPAGHEIVRSRERTEVGREGRGVEAEALAVELTQNDSGAAEARASETGRANARCALDRILSARQLVRHFLIRVAVEPRLVPK